MKHQQQQQSYKLRIYICGLKPKYFKFFETDFISRQAHNTL